MLSSFITLFSLFSASVLCADKQAPLKASHLPIVIWHGMGDYFDSDSMQRVNDTLTKTLDGVETYFISLKNTSSADQRATVLGDAMTQVLDVCDELSSMESLKNGFNGIGFSQGGLFMRSVVEMCGLPIHTLITFGSPHNGVTDFPLCDTWLCKQRNRILRSQVYDSKIQDSVIQAQYFRDVNDYDTYIEKSGFLKYVNNEFITNRTYIKNIARLDKLVLVKFNQDRTLVPKESAWMWDTESSDESTPIPFNQTDSYMNDLIGFQSLDKAGKIDFLSVEGEHMKIPDKDLESIATKYL